MSCRLRGQSEKSGSIVSFHDPRKVEGSEIIESNRLLIFYMETLQHLKILDIDVAKMSSSRAQHILDPDLPKEPVRGKVVVHLGGTTLSESRDVRLLNTHIKIWG